MNTRGLLGVLLVLYSLAVFAIALLKPKAIWNMKKIQFFRNRFGEKGTVVFFLVWGVVALIVAIWLLATTP